MICPKCGTDSKVSDNPEQAIARESSKWEAVNET